MRKYHPDGDPPDFGVIFVFGSNSAGRHGKGAAQYARDVLGAKPGQGEGLMINCYGIPTKYGNLQVKPLSEINESVQRFVEFTKAHPQLQWHVSAVGCGLAGYEAQDIAPMFKHAINCSFPDNWRDYLELEDV